mgnify:CR=1 FL=1
MKKLKSNFIMFLVLIAYMAIVIVIFIKTSPSKAALVIGIPISFIYAMVCFFNKRIRSKMTIWWGFLSFVTAIWWIYLMTK